jgi:two-component system cell cycle response regulator
MSLQSLDECLREPEDRERLSAMHLESNARALSAARENGSPRESVESALRSALRSNDPELDQILCALEEISNGLKSGAPNARSLDNALRRVASCALRQSLMDREIRCLALTDELTGLNNRRGFLAAATHQLKLAHRQGEDVLLLFCDVDNLKQINDSFGHREGDLALVRAAAALKETFRDSDILARLGGDEFAVLASDASIPSRQAIVPRMENILEKTNAACMRYRLSFSIGVARFDPHTPASLGELMARADQDMYVHKRFHRELRLSQR